MGTPLALARRPSWARHGTAVALAGAVVGVVALAVPAQAGVGYTESLRVDAAGSRAARTSMHLIAGHTYRIEVSGMYRVDDVTADAECAMSQLDAIYSPDTEGSAYELLVNGHDIVWAPAQADLMGCDSRAHEYSFSMRPAADGPLELRLNLPPGSDGANGALEVRVTGDAAKSATSTTTPPTNPPTTTAGPATSQPVAASGGASAPTGSQGAPAEKADGAVTPEARATIEDLLGTLGGSDDDVVMVTQAGKEGGGLAAGPRGSAGSRLGAVFVLGLVAAAVAATAVAPVRRRLLAAARGMDGFDVGLRQTAHRGGAAATGAAGATGDAVATAAAVVTEPARKAMPRLSPKRRATTALAHRSAARAERVATLIVDDLPSAGISSPPSCSCGYCK